MVQTVIYPGTFDPMTNGHVDIIERASKLFEKVIVAVAPSNRKTTMFTLDERLTLISGAVKAFPHVQVATLNGLLVDFARQHHAQVILRGLRAVSDFDYEFQLAHMNWRMAPDIETVFLPGSQESSFISGMMVREIVGLGGDISPFVPPAIAQYLKEKL